MQQVPSLQIAAEIRDERLLDLARQLHFGFEAFAHDHLFLQEIVLNGKRGLLRNASDDLSRRERKRSPPGASSISITPYRSFFTAMGTANSNAPGLPRFTPCVRVELTARTCRPLCVVELAGHHTGFVAA